MKQTKVGQTNGWHLNGLMGLAVMCASALIITSIAAALMLHEKLSISTMKAVTVVTQFVAVFLGSICTGNHTLGKRIPVSMVVTLCYYFLLLSGTILLFGGEFESVILNLTGGLLGFGLCLLVRMKKKTPQYLRSRKHGNVKMNKFYR